jgi:hypothetical protein
MGGRQPSSICWRRGERSHCDRTQEVAKRGITAPALLDIEVTAKVGLFSEQEIETFSQANKAWLHRKEATGQEQLRTHLQHQKLAAQWLTFLHALPSQANVVMHLTTPPVCHA